ncbi:MAG: hypothetical protein JW932_06565 [Deltaproteobacteria bacterium]|nr:hypothetical protein [Deltaproteobacteria bacterium]
MSERKNTPDLDWDLQIGGETIRLTTESSNGYLLHLVKRFLGDYHAASGEATCNIRIIPFPYIYKHPWEMIEIDRFRNFFSEVHGRYPRDDQPDRIDLSLRLMQYLDPESEVVRHIRQMIDGQRLTYARIGMDLFFFDTGTRTAFLFIGETFKRFPLVQWMMKIFDLGQSMIWSGILNGIMFILSHLLIYNHGLLLHGSALQKDGHGYLFLGVSGAGKSTITRLIGPDICLSDDGVILKREMGAVFVYDSPFRQFDRPGKDGDPAKIQLQKVFILEKADQNKTLPVKKNELMDCILRHMIHFYKFMDRETAEKGFYITKDMVGCLPAYRLQFSKRRDLWDSAILNRESEVNHA